ncbi:MAG: ureidoglycolate lyase [Gammaproteobacteria bacterium]|nr:ureidoglycolate lyase [Gammaproteobacteria bacterium]
MAKINLKLQPLTREAFSPFGDIIETEGARHFSINAGTIERFHDLAQVDIGTESDGRPLISIAQCNQATELPFPIKFVERHSLGTQAFIPFLDIPLPVVVAPPGEMVDPQNLRAFVTNGKQGINYHRGVWHLPLIALQQDQQFLIVDRAGPGQNCDEFYFTDDEIVLTQQA